MNFDFLVPVLTYPDATREGGLTRALDMAASISGKISVVVHAIDIPPVGNIMAETLIDLSTMIATAEQHSRVQGEHLAGVIRRIATRISLPWRSKPSAAGPRSSRIGSSRGHDFTTRR